MKEKTKEVVQILKVLANENRLMIVCVLMQQSMNVSSMAAYIPHITQSALSQHLGVLKANRVLDCCKSGQNVTYFIADHRVEEVIKLLQKYYCLPEHSYVLQDR